MSLNGANAATITIRIMSKRHLQRALHVRQIAEDRKNCLAIFTIFRHLRRATHVANGVIELTLA